MEVEQLDIFELQLRRRESANLGGGFFSGQPLEVARLFWVELFTHSKKVASLVRF